jgi:hypothetical protein
MGDKRNAYMILVGKPEGKRPLGRPRRRWVDDIKMDLREIEWGVMHWRSLVNMVMKLQVPKIADFLSSCTIDSFSRRAQLHEVSQLISVTGEYHG